MRRSVAAAVVTLSTALSVATAPGWSTAATGSDVAMGSPRVTESRSTHATARTAAQHALRTASRVVSGRATGTEASMSLLRLRLTMHALAPSGRRRAAALLARPTDSPDPYGLTYQVKAKRKCAGHICIHWVPTGGDAPPGTRWVDRQLRMLNHAWRYEVHRLGYHRPVSDGARGGGAGMFDVYLAEMFHRGLYGLTVAEQPASYNKHLYSSYLVIDNDFRRSQYHATPMQVARVTAAHELFHAVQYGYDVGEDPWLMETSSTWMEEQFDDSSNDNRQYLLWSQLEEPGTPLDTFSRSSFEQYGNWVFLEYLGQHYGRRIVRSIWTRAARFSGGGHLYSSAAIRAALRKHGGMTSVFGRYANANTTPGRSYSEGRFYPAAGMTSAVTLTRASPGTSWTTYAVHHLASVNLRATPGSDLVDRTWGLRVKVDGPRRSTSPAVVVQVLRKHHHATRTPVTLSRTGRGSVTVPFSTATTRRVTITLANASTRFTCHTGGGFSCNGTSKSPHPRFAVRLLAVQ